MKKTILVIAIAISMVCCGTKYNYTDTGKASPYFDGNMYEYLQSNSYNWDSIVNMIDRAQLQGVFKQEDITFMGLTNHTIRRWLILGGSGFAKGYKQISDIPVGMCHSIIMSHVIQGKILRDQVQRATYDELGNRTGGGQIVKTMYGNQIWLGTKQDPYLGIPGVGPVSMSMSALKVDGITQISTTKIASPDIQPKNGVVHAIEYNYNIDDIGPLTEK